MPTGMFEVETIPTATTPLANPMQNVPERSTSRADEPLPHSAVERHRPLAQTHDDRTPGRLNHDARAGPGNPRERHTGSSSESPARWQSLRKVGVSMHPCFICRWELGRATRPYPVAPHPAPGAAQAWPPGAW